MNRLGTAITTRYSLVAVIASVLSVTQCGGQDTSDWLVVDNRTGTAIVITEERVNGVHQVGGMGANEKGFGVGGREYCDSRELEARAESIDGPVIDRRPASDGENCVTTWVIEAE